MKTSVRFFALALLGFGLVAGTTGCELSNCDNSTTDGGTAKSGGTCIQGKSLKKFVAPDRNKTAQWASGGSITISDFNGPITVVKGSGTTVSATFTPVDLRAYDTKDADIQADFAALATDATDDGSGNVTIKAYQNGHAHSGLGAELTVALPDSFDGALTVSANNGKSSIQFVGNASGVKLTSDNGSCDVAAGSAASLDVSCNNGDVSGSVGALPASASGGTVKTGNGSITMHFDGSQTFNVQASTLAGGTVDVGNAEAAGCTVVAGGSDSGQTVSCGGAGQGDPTYVLQADGTSLADVTLSF